ncbi:unnamed protein product [Pichia kudriavzevii]
MSILLVDSYDSFTYNLRDLVRRATNAQVITIHNDSYDIEKESDSVQLDTLVESVDAIVIGPGPGSPTKPSDIGVIPHLYKQYIHKPILGICLGFQTLCLANNCKVDYLEEPIHGQIHSIDVVDHSSIFRNLPDKIDSVRYHSIYVDEIDSSKTIKPLAFFTGENNVKILMAAQHREYPHFGVQYHPESICSEYGFEVVENFWNLVKSRASDRSIAHDNHLVSATPLIESFESNGLFKFQYSDISSILDTEFDILEICDTIQSDGQDTLLLNSASAPGQWSIVGMPINKQSLVITHSTESPNEILVNKWNANEFETIEVDDIFKFLAKFVSQRYFNPTINHQELKTCPFVGGLIGYMSYEEGFFVDRQNLKKRTKSNIDDTKLCFIERFIAISPEKKAYAVTIKEGDDQFLSNLRNLLKSRNTSRPVLVESLSREAKITTPDKEVYFRAFHECQKYLKLGDSYELCLTYNTIVHLPEKYEPWEIYKALVKKNPSPYSAYLNFKSSMLLSTSPERFISWNDKFCQMRPIKGTLKKNPEIDYQKACKLLKIPKELGENLMIVDLIRDNLLYLLDKINVTELMSVEEYETIYQLVSVIEGEFTNKFTGIDVLKNSLPPGSMTGAPKKRSVEILQQLEDNQRRGLYSGICGYWSLNDNADWSVIIRSLFRYADDLDNMDGYDTYRCGAGGALTVLSTDQGEWDEMLIKLHSVLQLFE